MTIAGTTAITELWAKVKALVATKSTVSVSQTLTSGTQIGSITVDGTATTLYAPSGGGSVSFRVTVFDFTIASTAAAQNSADVNYNMASAISGYDILGVVGGYWVSGTRQNYMTEWVNYVDSNGVYHLRFRNTHTSSAANGVYRVLVALAPSGSVSYDS